MATSVITFFFSVICYIMLWLHRVGGLSWLHAALVVKLCFGVRVSRLAVLCWVLCEAWGGLDSMA